MANVSPEARYAFEYYKKKGLTDIGSAGFVGNLMGESDMNPLAIRKNDAGPGKHSKGIGQWNRDRLEALEKFAADNGKSPDDFDTQLDFAWSELNGKEAATYQRLMSAKDIDAATDAGIMYERPQGSENGPRSGHNWSGRNANARALLGMDPSTVADYSPTSVPASGTYNPTTGQGPQAGEQIVNPIFTTNAAGLNVEMPTTNVQSLTAAPPTWGDLFDAAPRELGTRNMMEYFGRANDVPDPAWAKTRTPETFSSTPGFAGLDSEWQDYVMENSVSQQSMLERIDWAREQMTARDNLDRGGLSGLMLRGAAALTDPAMWAAELATGGTAGTAMVGGRLARAGAEAARQTGIQGVVSAPKLLTDAHYSTYDLAVDSSIAMAAGGLFGGLSRNLGPDVADSVQGAFVQHAERQIATAQANMEGRSVGAAETYVPYMHSPEGVARAEAVVDNRSGFERGVDAVRIDSHSAGVDTGNVDVVNIFDSLMPDPVGNGGLISKGQTDAWTWMHMQVKGIKAEYDGAVEDAFKLYMDEQSGGRGVAAWNINDKLTLRHQFDREISAAIQATDKSDLAPSVRKASEAWSRGASRALKAAQEADYKAVKDIEHSESYFAFINNRERFRAAVGKFGMDGVIDGVAQLMEKAGGTDSARTFASRIAHREARLEAGWAVDDVRDSIVTKIKDELGEDVKAARDEAKASISKAKHEKDAEIAELNRLHEETMEAAKAEAKDRREQAKALRKDVESNKHYGVDRAARLQQEAQDLMDEADEILRAAKAATAKARAASRNHLARRRDIAIRDAKAEVSQLRRHASAEAASQLDTVGPKLVEVWNEAYGEAAEREFGRALRMWEKRYARKYVETLQRVNESNDALHMRGISGEDVEALKEYLVKSGFSESDAELAAGMLKAKSKTGIKHTRRRAPIDRISAVIPKGSTEEFRASDLFEDDASKVLEKYTHSMLSAGALARNGWQSEAAARQAIADATDVVKLREAGVYVPASKEAAYKKARQVADMYLDRILGKPDGDPENFAKVKQGGRIFRNLAFASYMVMNGLAQVGDAARVVARVGVGAAFEHFDLKDAFRVYRASASGRKGNEIAEAFEIITGEGRSNASTRVFTLYEGTEKYFGESMSEKLLGRAEQFSKSMAAATSLVSGGSAVTDFLVRWSQRSTLQAIVNHALGGKQIGKKLLNDMGFDASTIANLKAMVADKAIVLADTGMVRRLDFDKINAKWAREMDDLMARVTREAKVQVLEASPAHLPRLMQNDVGRLFGQFKTFMVASYASNSLRGIKMHDASSAMSLVLSSFLGAITYAGQVHMKSVGMSEKRREEYLNKMLYSRTGATTAILGRSGDLSVLPMIVDSIMEPLSALTGKDLRVFEQGRVSGLSNDIINGMPVVNMGKRLYDLAFGSLVDAARKDQVVTQQEAMSRVSLIIPWLKTYGLLNATQAVLSMLPDKEPRDKTFDPDQK